jgi:hypothetical protein
LRRGKSRELMIPALGFQRGACPFALRAPRFLFKQIGEQEKLRNTHLQYINNILTICIKSGKLYLLSTTRSNPLQVTRLSVSAGRPD